MMHEDFEMLYNDEFDKREMHRRYKRSDLTKYEFEEIQEVIDQINDLNGRLKVFFKDVCKSTDEFIENNFPPDDDHSLFRELFDPYYDILLIVSDWDFNFRLGKTKETYPLGTWMKKVKSYESKLKRTTKRFNNLKKDVENGIYPKDLATHLMIKQAC